MQTKEQMIEAELFRIVKPSERKFGPKEDEEDEPIGIKPKGFFSYNEEITFE
jgi:hypothetical protein